MVRHYIVALVFVVACVIGDAVADTVILKDGRQFTGKITNEDDKTVAIDAMIHGIRGVVALRREDIATIEKKDLPQGFFDHKQGAAISASPGTQPGTQIRTIDPELAKWRQRLIALDNDRLGPLRQELKDTEHELAELRKHPDSSGTIHLAPGDDPLKLLGTPTKVLHDASVFKLEKQVADMRRQVNDLTASISAAAFASMEQLQPRIDAVQAEDERNAARAKDRERWLAMLPKLYDTPEKAAQFCVDDLFVNGVIKTATRLQVGKIQLAKAQWALESGQWSTPSLGIVAPGAKLPALPAGMVRRPTKEGAQVSFTFTFVTEAGLLREHVGFVLVANADGFWEPFSYDVDGLSGCPPYAGRDRYLGALEQAERHGVPDTPQKPEDHGVHKLEF